MLENKPSTNSASPDAKKVKPPFTDLPAFNVAATIMSFLGYQDEMMSLLAQLNHNSILYSERHFEIKLESQRELAEQDIADASN